MPLATCSLLVSQWIQGKFAARWFSTDKCVHTKGVWPQLEKARSRELLRLSKPNMSRMVGVITGHCLLGVHALRLKAREGTFCRSCMEEELESPKHIVLQCPAFARTRGKLLGSFIFNSWKELEAISLARISRFVKNSGTLDRDQ